MFELFSEESVVIALDVHGAVDRFSTEIRTSQRYTDFTWART